MHRNVVRTSLKESYDDAKKNILCIWYNAMCLHGLRLKKHIICHTLYIIVAPLLGVGIFSHLTIRFRFCESWSDSERFLIYFPPPY